MTTMNETTALEDLTISHLSELSTLDNDSVLSILMPTHRTGSEIRQDPIRYKNLVDSVREQASQFERGDEMIQRLGSRLPQSDFWQHQGLGLTICMWMLRLPTEVEGGSWSSTNDCPDFYRWFLSQRVSCC